MPLHYPQSVVPEAGAAVEIEAGIHWLRLPLPFALDHINVWLLEDGDGWTLVDTGAGVSATKQAWEQLFRSGIGSRPVTRIIVTHHHPDHFGLARWLCERFGIEVHGTGPAVNRAAKLLNHADTGNHEAAAEFFRAHGAADPEGLVRFTSGHTYRRIVSGLPERIGIIDAGAELRIGGHSWRAIISDGHAEGHLSLYCQALNILISGDQILPAITSNISLFENDPELNPLRDYLDGMESFQRLPESVLVLPSHGKVFRGLHGRVAEITDAHMSRSQQVYGFCDAPATVSAVAARLFPRQLDDINTCLAFGETYSHLRYLEKAGRVRCMADNNLFLYQA